MPTIQCTTIVTDFFLLKVKTRKKWHVLKLNATEKNGNLTFSDANMLQLAPFAQSEQTDFRRPILAHLSVAIAASASVRPLLTGGYKAKW